MLIARDSKNTVKKTFVSLIKDVMRKCKPVIIPFLVEKESGGSYQPSMDSDISNWFSKVTECTIPDFCASVMSSPRWTFIAEFVDTGTKGLVC